MFDEKTLKRFWSKVDIRHEGECWPWKAKARNHGYGWFFTTAIQGPIRSSRYALGSVSKSFPKRMFALHSCDNRLCCNPRHLRWGTDLDNKKDMWARNYGFMERLKRRTSEMGRRTVKFAQMASRKYTKEQILMVRELSSKKMSNRKVSKITGVSHYTVWGVVSGKTYKDWY